MAIEAENGLRAGQRYLTTADLAERWRLSRWTLRQLAKAGRITGAERVGRDWRFAEDAMLVRAMPAPSPERATAAKASHAIDELLVAHRRRRRR